MPVRWGGAREGAGRKAAARPRVWHRGRAEFPESHPGLVTIRVRSDVPSLRTVRLVREVERSLRAIAKRADFRVVHYSLQHDHVHLLVESEGVAALSKGMKSLAARLARAVNRVFDRRGAVLDGRYHHRALGTPREVRAALRYVLLNARKHAAQRAPDCAEHQRLRRSRFVGPLVRGMGRVPGSARRSPRGRATANLAAASGLAATWTHPQRRSPRWTVARLARPNPSRRSVDGSGMASMRSDALTASVRRSRTSAGREGDALKPALESCT